VTYASSIEDALFATDAVLTVAITREDQLLVTVQDNAEPLAQVMTVKPAAPPRSLEEVTHDEAEEVTLRLDGPYPMFDGPEAYYVKARTKAHLALWYEFVVTPDEPVSPMFLMPYDGDV
jgi:hypothetical protein